MISNINNEHRNTCVTSKSKYSNTQKRRLDHLLTNHFKSPRCLRWNYTPYLSFAFSYALLGQRKHFIH